MRDLSTPTSPLSEQSLFQKCCSKLGQQTNVNHDACGDRRKRLYVRRVPGGWVYHCHNCAPNFSGFYRDSSVPPPSETLQRVETDSGGTESGEVHLPEDFSVIVPDAGLRWLLKYGILLDEIKTYRIGYSKELNRLILPFYRDGVLKFWQGRSLDGSLPKYTSPKIKNPDKFGVLGHINSNTLVLVEDLVSAIKVGRVAAALPLFGSFIPVNVLDFFLPYDKIIIWLDQDKSKEALKFAHRFRQLSGKDIKVVSTTLDPKCYSEKELKLYLNA